jgi:hypothetical protein
MIRSRSAAPWGGALLLLAGPLSCTPSFDVAPGPPAILAFDVVDLNGSVVDVDPDAGPVSIPPLAQFVARFDRLLDPTPLERVTDAGIEGRANVASIEAPGAPGTAISYTPNGDARFFLLLPPGPSVTVTAVPTLPSGSTVTVRLDRQSLRAKDGTSTAVLAPGVADTLTIQTAPFSAEVELPPASATDGGAAPGPIVDPDFVGVVAFNNLPEAAIADRVRVTARDAAGGAVTVTPRIRPSDRDPTRLLVDAGEAGWPAGATVTITVDGAAADLLGMKMASAVTATFRVKG